MPQTVKDTTSNLMTINLQRNKTNKLLEKKKHQFTKTDPRKNRKPTWSYNNYEKLGQ